MDQENIQREEPSTRDEEPTDEDVASDFFDDFNKEEFMEGLSVIDSWDDGDKKRRGSRIDAEAVDSVKDLRELIKDGKYGSERRDDEDHKMQSEALDDYIRPGSRRDPNKTIEAIKRDKEVKVKQHIAKHLEGDLRPPGTELDDFYLDSNSAEKRNTLVADEKDPPSRHSREFVDKSMKRMRYRSHSRDRERDRNREHDRDRERDRDRRDRYNTPEKGYRKYHQNPGWNHRPGYRRSPGRSYRKSPVRRRPSPPRRSSRYSRSPDRRYRSRSSDRRYERHSRDHSHGTDSFLYPHGPPAPQYQFDIPAHNQNYPGPTEYMGPTAYNYPTDPTYPGYTKPYEYNAPPSVSIPPSASVPEPSAGPVWEVSTSSLGPPPVPAPPPMVPAPKSVNPEKTATPPEDGLFDPLAKLLAEGKISEADYYKLAPNKGSSPIAIKDKDKVLHRCEEAIKKLNKLQLPNQLMLYNNMLGPEPKFLTHKYCSPLKRQAVVEFHFTKPEGKASTEKNKQLLESIMTTIGLEKVVSKMKKNTPARNIVDAAVQTMQPYCDVCEIREMKKFYDVSTSVEPEYFTSSIHTQVVEQDLVSSKAVFNPSGSVGVSPMSIAHLTPAQLVSQLAARAKTFKQTDPPEPPSMYMRPPQNRYDYNYDGSGGSQYYNNPNSFNRY